jgi:hypothetical protein
MTPSSSPSSLARKKPRNKTKHKSKSTLRVVTEILFVLLVIELYFYQKLSRNEFEDLEARRSRFPNTPQTRNQKPQKKQNLTPEERNQKRAEQKQERFHTKKESQAFAIVEDEPTDALASERRRSAHALERMGVSSDVRLSELPPWSQIVDNFGGSRNGGGGDDDEPVILGLDGCAAFREQTDPDHIGIAPAGLFSTGTSLIYALTASNCLGPNGRMGMADKFALVQVPVSKQASKRANNIPMAFFSSRVDSIRVDSIRVVCQVSYSRDSFFPLLSRSL